MTYETLQVRRDGYVQIIGLNRPDKRNAFDSTMLRELAAAYGELDADDTLRAGVLYGEGTMFTAGLDLASVASDIQSNVSHVPEGGINPWQVDGRQLSKPLVVAVHGKVLTLGIELMLAADIAVAAESATFAQLEVARGIYPFGGATIRFPNLPVPPRRRLGHRDAVDTHCRHLRPGRGPPHRHRAGNRI